MTTFQGRAAEPLRLAATICALFGLLFIMTGCGALGAMANPKVAWAIQDPAPMSVVVRRADAAEATAKQVDRILTSTPARPALSSRAGTCTSTGPRLQRRSACGRGSARGPAPRPSKRSARN